MVFETSAISPKLSLVAMLVGGIVVLASLSLSFVPGETNFEASAALGTETTFILGSHNGFSIHCTGYRDAENCLSGQRSRGASQAALLLGNSQLHEVNQWQPSEIAVSSILFDSLGWHDLDLLTFSFGNANLQEHLVLFEYLRQRMPLKFLFLPIVFDDMREEGLRPDVGDFARDLRTAKLLSETDIGKRLVTSLQSSGKKIELVSTADDTGGITGSPQERVENRLNDWLGGHSRLWQLRSEIRGWLFIKLYQLRNSVFGITSSTTRKVIPGRYRDNIAALQAILYRARSENIHVMMYIVPLRGGVKIPYALGEYELFKSEMEVLALKYGANFKNFEQLIPDYFWGTKASTSLKMKQEIDFMHFTHAGHRVLAQALHELVINEISIRKVGAQ